MSPDTPNKSAALSNGSRKLLAIAALLFAAILTAGEVEELETLTRQWLSLRESLARVDAEWAHEQEALDRENALLRREEVALARRVATLEAETGDASAPPVALDPLPDAIQEARTALETLVARLPAGVRVDIRQTLHAVKDDAPGPARLQALFDALLLALDAQRTAHLERTIVQVDRGESVTVDILYLGSSAAFALTLDRQSAAIGLAGEEGWSWKFSADLAAAVATAMERYRGKTDQSAPRLPIRLERAEP